MCAWLWRGYGCDTWEPLSAAESGPVDGPFHVFIWMKTCTGLFKKKTVTKGKGAGVPMGSQEERTVGRGGEDKADCKLI